MFNALEFNLLIKMNDLELEREIVRALQMYNDCQERFIQLEKEMQKEHSLLFPSLDILFSQLQNIEGYIRKAENLLNEWESSRYVKANIKLRVNHFKKKNIKLLKI